MYVVNLFEIYVGMDLSEVVKVVSIEEETFSARWSDTFEIVKVAMMGMIEGDDVCFFVKDV